MSHYTYVNRLITFTIYFLFQVLISVSQSYTFIENKKQWDSNILYKCEIPGGVLFLESQCFTYSFYEKHQCVHDQIIDEEITMNSGHESPKCLPSAYHAFKMHFENSNPDVTVDGKNPSSGYVNYFIGNDKSKWATGLNCYKLIEYKELYDNIDLRIYSEDERLIYDIIINPDGDINDIELSYEGVDELKLSGENLLIKTSINEIVEEKPYAYQVINNDTTAVSCKFILNGNKVKFELSGSYIIDIPIIIDPELIFATYSGSTADNWGFTATYDNDGNVYSGGIVYAIGYPVSTGAFQDEFGGLWDVGIIKYNSTGTERLYATYLGGSSSEMPQSFIVNEYNELLILGTTGSSDFPVLSNAYDNSFNGGSYIYYMGIKYASGTDIFVSKLSEDGDELTGSTFIGGTSNDGLNFRSSYDYFDGNDNLYHNYGDGARGEIITDDQNDVYIGTCTFSDDFPVTASVFQNVNNGEQEGVIFKLDYSLSNLIWSSYIGGSEDDAVYSIDVDNDYELFVAGGTMSDDFPTTSGAYMESRPGGTVDAFVAHVSRSGDELKASTFYGSDAYDQAYFARSDRNNNIYIYGQTEALANTLIYNASYNTPNSGQFIAKLTNELDTIEWSTVFGTGNGKSNISPTAFAVDICNRIYISGCGREWCNTYSGQWTYDASTGYYYYDYGWLSVDGTNGMEVTSDAYQSETDGQDFYIMVLSMDASSLLYATFFGELHYGQYYYNPNNNKYYSSGCLLSGRDHVDGGTSRFDKYGNIYQSVCASCGGCQGIPVSPSDVWSSTNNSSSCNNAVFRIQLTEDIVVAEVETDTICAPDTLHFYNNSNGKQYTWYLEDTTITTIGNEDVACYIPEGGLYTFTIIAIDSASCNIADTLTLELLIGGNESFVLDAVSICSGENVQIGLSPDGSYTYSWSSSESLTDTSVANPYASPTETTTYLLLRSNGVCTDTIYQAVEVIEDQKTSKQANIWYFGYEAGITFNTSPPTALTNSAMTTGEGCAVICDEDGNLLFYTDGVTVWNNEHSEMLNGTALNGNESATQSAIIVPKPGSQDLFYIFTVDYQSGSNGCCYSIVDMQGDNGSGEITDKNVLLHQNSTEKLTAVMHVNRTDYWIVIHEQNSDAFYAYLLTDSGIETLPIISNIGSFTGNDNETIGYMKFSPDGSKIVYACFGGKYIEIFDFDNSSGEISNPVTISGYQYPYGLEFSPNNLKLYVQLVDNSIYQFDLTVYDEETIRNSVVKITENGGNVIQLGSDGKIYVAKFNSEYLGEISNPDEAGTDVNYMEEAIYLDGKSCLTGLPNSVQSFYSTTSVSYQNSCLDSLSYFSVSNVGDVQSVHWDFGDGNTSDSLNATNVYTSPGIYTVELILEYLCDVDTIIKTITVNADTFAVESNIIKCAGTTVTLSVDDDKSGYEWYANNVALTEYNDSSWIEATKAAVYYVAATDENGCPVSSEITVSDYPAISVTYDSQNISCFGLADGSVSVTATGSYPFQYSTDNINFYDDAVFNNLTAGIYTFYVSDNNGCVTSKQIEITEPTALSVTWDQTDATCYGFANGAISVTASGGTSSYQYVLNTLTSENGIFQNLTSGVYSFTVVDTNGCSVSSQITINQNAAISITFDYTIPTCYGLTDGNVIVSASGGTSPYSYSVDNINFSTNTEFSNLTAGIYTFYVVDSSGCQARDTLHLDQFSSLSITFDIQLVSCYGFNDGVVSFEVTGGSSPYSFSVAGSSLTETATFSDLYAGTYTYTISDNNGCKSTGSIEIEQPDQIIPVKTITGISCFGESDGIAEITATGGVAPYKYQLNAGSVYTYNIFNNLAEGIYTFTMFDSSNCSVTDTFQITQPSALSVTFDKLDVKCYGLSNGQVTIIASGGTPEYSYSTDNETPVDSAVFTNLQQGIYTFLIIDQHNCVISTQVEITSPTELSFTYEKEDVKCYGDSTASITIHASGGTGSYLYSVDSESYKQYPVFSGLPAGTYAVSAKDQNDCIRDSVIMINSPDSLYYDYCDKTDNVCYGENKGTISAVFSGGTGNYQFSIDDGVYVASNEFDSLYAGTYKITVIDENDCIDTVLITISQPDELLISQTVTDVLCDSVCNGEISVTLSGGTEPYTLRWNTKDYEYPEEICEGIYTLNIYDANNCHLEEIIIVGNQKYEPSLEVTADEEEIYRQQSTILHASGDYTVYEWSPDSSLNNVLVANPVATPYNTTTYTVVITDENGCQNADSITIEVKDVICGDPYVYIPNAFTPGDATYGNNIFHVRSNIVADIYFVVFDRWGEKVFETNDIDTGWDGTYKGELLMPGVYVYYVKVSCLNSEIYEKKGNITLIR